MWTRRCAYRALVTVALLGVLALWIASFWHLRVITPWASLDVRYGTVWFQVASPLDSRWWSVRGRSEVYRTDRVLLLIGNRFSGYQCWSFDFSLWPLRIESPLVVPIALFTGLLVHSRWRERRGRAAAGRCRFCGYDLRGNVSGRCPECGTAVPARPPPVPIVAPPRAGSDAR